MENDISAQWTGWKCYLPCPSTWKTTFPTSRLVSKSKFFHKWEISHKIQESTTFLAHVTKSQLGGVQTKREGGQKNVLGIVSGVLIKFSNCTKNIQYWSSTIRYAKTWKNAKNTVMQTFAILKTTASHNGWTRLKMYYRYVLQKIKNQPTDYLRNYL